MPAVRVWDGGGATNLWTDRFNWQGDLAPTAGDDLVFAAGADPTSLTTTNDFSAGATFNSLTFNAAGYTLQGNGITLGSGGVTHDVAGATGQSVIDFGLNLLNTRNFTVVQPGPNDALLLSGTLTGSGGITKLGAGSLGIDSGAGSNTNTGPTSVNAGELRVHSDGDLGATASGTTVQAGASLDLASNDLSYAEPLTLNGGALRGSPNSEWIGGISLTAHSRIEGAQTFVISGVVSGPVTADLTLDGGAFLAGFNTYQGFTTVESGVVSLSEGGGLGSAVQGTRVLDGGVINLNGDDTVFEPLFLNGGGLLGGGSANGALTLPAGATDRNYFGDLVIESDTEIAVANGGRLHLSGSISGDPTATMTKVGPGEQLYVTSANEAATFTGRTRVSGGTITLNTPNRNAIVGDLDIENGTVRLVGTLVAGVPVPSTGNHQISDAITISIGLSGLLDLNDNIEVVGPLNLTGGDIDTGTGILQLNSNITTNASSSTATISGKLQLGSADRTIAVASGPASTDLSINAIVSGPASTDILKSGGGSLALLGANTYLGHTTVGAGFLLLGNSTGLGAANSATTIAAGATIDLFGTLTVNDVLFLNGTGVDDSGVVRTFGDSTLASVKLTSDSTIGVRAGDELTVNNVGDNVPSGGPTLTKIGPGTLIYGGATTNSFDGTTRIHDGILRLNKTPDSSANLAGGGAIFGGSLVIGDGVGQDKVILDLDRQIANGVGITINPHAELELLNHDETVGPLTMTAGRIDTGAGLLTLGADVTVNASSIASFIVGNLSLGVGASGVPGAGGINRTFTVADGAAGSELLINSAPISSGVVNFVKRGAGILEFAGGPAGVAPTYLGTTSVLEGTLFLDRPDGVASVSPHAVIVGDATAPAGSARLVLGSSDQLPSSITVNRSGLFDLGGHNETLNQLSLAGGRVETGLGTLTIGSLSSSASDAPAVVNGKLALSGASSSFFVADGAATEDVIVNAAVSGTQLFKTLGTGTLVLAGGGTLGAIQVREGMVRVNGSQLASAVTVDALDADGATLSGVDGSAGAVTVLDGTLSPGGTPGNAGSLTFANGLTFSSSAGGTRRLVVDLNGDPNLGVNNDQVSVVGAINLGNGITNLVINTPAGFTANPGDTFVIVSSNGASDAVVGQFAGLPEGAALNAGGQPFHITYRGINGLDGNPTNDDNDIVLIRDTPTTGPGISVNDVAVFESGGSSQAVFTVSLAQPSNVPVSFDFVTQDNTARVPGDYTAGIGTRTFDIGETVQTIAVPVSNDATDENDETFFLHIFSPVNGFVADGLGVGVIVDDDTPPTITIDDAQLTEGNTGTANMQFTVRLSAPSEKPVNVNFATANGTALSPGDYTATSGSVAFGPGQITRTIQVPIVGDALGETNETFLVNLSGPVNATISDSQAVGTIGNNDPTPALQNRSLTVVINEGGVATLGGTIVLTNPKDRFILEINWGDGTPVQKLRFPTGSNGRVISINHRYRDNPTDAPVGAYAVHAFWHNQLGGGNSADFAVLVNNVAPAVAAGSDIALGASGLFNRGGSFQDPGADSWVAWVDYGDGNDPKPLKLRPNGSFQLQHKYLAPGTYRVTVTVLDDDGGIGTDSFLVTVPG